MKNENPNRPLQLLLVEDSPSDAVLLQENILSRSAGDFSVNVVPSLQKAIDHLKNNHPDAVLLDLTLPDSSGLNTVKQARHAAPDAPIIVLTGLADEKLGMEAIHAGVQDYLVKGQADGQTILRAVRYAIERKKAEQALRESEERFRLLVENVQDYAIFMLDPQGRVVTWNFGAQHLKGYSTEEIIGKHFSCFYLPEDIEASKSELTIALKDGHHTDEGWRVRKDGSRFWATVTTTALHEVNGTLRGYVKITRDITERKKAEEALHESKDYLDKLIRYANAPIIVWDPEMRITRFNGGFEKLTGYLESELLGKNLSLLFPEDSREASLEKIGKARKGEQWEYAEIPILCKDGRIKLALWNSANIYAKDGTTLLATIAQGTDITERKKTEEQIKRLSQELEKKVEVRTSELKGANELLRLEVIERAKAEESLAKRQQVLESIYAIETTFSVSIEDLFDQIVLTISNLVNLPFVAVGRVEKGRFTTIAQLSDNEFSHEKSIPLTAHPCGIAAREKKIIQYSGNLKTMFPEQMKALEQDYKSYIGITIYNKEGNAIGVICAMSSSERAFSDLELHSIEIFARYLGHEIEHEIMDNQLRAAGEMNLLGRIASGVAHEVRNPLNGILAISEALFQELGNRPEHLPYLVHIKNQVNRLSSLMRDLLDLGKPLTQSEFIPQPLEPMIISAIDSLKHSASHKDHTVNFKLAPAGVPTMVKSDAVKLQQVFFNLIDNACDHSPAAEPITIEMSLTSHAEPEVVVHVTDKGKGINPNLLEKVFDPFFTTRKGGTGLGLSIVKRIVELHQGTVSLANNVPGPGITVEVRLPVCAKQEETGS